MKLGTSNDIDNNSVLGCRVVLRFRSFRVCNGPPSQASHHDSLITWVSKWQSWRASDHSGHDQVAQTTTTVSTCSKIRYQAKHRCSFGTTGEELPATRVPGRSPGPEQTDQHVSIWYQSHSVARVPISPQSSPSLRTHSLPIASGSPRWRNMKLLIRERNGIGCDIDGLTRVRRTL